MNSCCGSFTWKMFFWKIVCKRYSSLSQVLLEAVMTPSPLGSKLLNEKRHDLPDIGRWEALLHPISLFTGQRPGGTVQRIPFSARSSTTSDAGRETSAATPPGQTPRRPTTGSAATNVSATWSPLTAVSFTHRALDRTTAPGRSNLPLTAGCK